jgi:hypothetical protein
MLFHEAVLAEILEERVVSSRGRTCPRGVKRKMSSYNLRPRGAKPSPPISYYQRILVFK